MAGRPDDRPEDRPGDEAPEGAPGEGTPQDGRPPADAPEDALWRSIVANYGDRPRLDDEPGPAPEHGRAAPAEEEPPELREADDERFVPPTPAPVVLRPDRTLAWVGVLGAPVLALLLVALTRTTALYVPGWVTLLLAAGFLGGFGYLVATMPKAREDPWDDGARL